MSTDAASDDAEAAPHTANEATPVFLMDGTRTTAKTRKITPYDFRKPTALPQSDLRIFQALYQKYIPNLAARLSTLLRMECMLKIDRLDSSPFPEFCDAMPDPACVTLFGLDEFRGVGVLAVHRPLALAMADRLLGGKGRAPSAERQLTEIEMALMEDVLQLILTAWSDLWIEGDHAVHLKVMGHESSVRCIPTPASGEIMVILTVAATIGEATERFHLAVPFSMIGQPLRRIQAAHNHSIDAKPVKQVQWRKQYAGIAVPAHAEWKVRELPIAETLRFREGDVIELPNSLINNASLQLSEGSTFIGTVGVQNGNVAVQITGRGNKD